MMRGLLLMLMMVGLGLPALAQEMLGSVGIQSRRIESIPKWVKVLGRMREDGVYYKCQNGTDCDGKVGDWWEMVNEAKSEDKFAQMVLVNRWLNNYPYITDGELWGKSDYWEIPREFVNKSGDCEDYAIAKYYTLKSLGWPESALKLAVVHDSVRDIPHAILLVNFGGKNYVLDNLASEPLLDRYVQQYSPYYAINAQNRWVFVRTLE